jgi:acyl-CoA thioesterase I
MKMGKRCAVMPLCLIEAGQAFGLIAAGLAAATASCLLVGAVQIIRGCETISGLILGSGRLEQRRLRVQSLWRAIVTQHAAIIDGGVIAIGCRRSRHLMAEVGQIRRRRRRATRSGIVSGANLALSVIGLVLAGPVTGSLAAERAVNIVAFGDSLTAGYGLAANDAFPAQLQRALAAKAVAVNIVNAGVSGDTATGGLSRLDWSVPDGTDAVILELGANDALRGVDPAVTRKALDAILHRFMERKIPVLLCGMMAPPNLGGEYGRAFNAIYPELAVNTGALLYPFFLTGVAADPALNQRDGIHPTAAGVAVIVARIIPQVEQLIARVREMR